MEEEERGRRRRRNPCPHLVGRRPPPATPSPRHIPPLTATKKGLPRDPEGAPNPNPTGTQESGPRRGHGDCAGGGGVFNDPPRPAPPPQLGRGKGGVTEGHGRQGHSRLERVLNGGGHGPLGRAASGPGRRCRRARAQPGLSRPLCRPARYDFIHSWGCGASGVGRAGGGAGPIPEPQGARRDVVSRGAQRGPKALLTELHIPGGVGRIGRPLAAVDTGQGGACP